MDNLTMYVVTHKNVEYIPKGRKIIFVGNGDNSKNYLADNTGENISNKNANYCELTAFYWIWKNDKNSKYISIEHYRRFFMGSGITPISKRKIEKNLEKYDVIESKNYYFLPSIKEYYSQHHIKSDLEVVEDAIEKLYPEYKTSYEKVINGDECSMCNMIVLSKENFDKYCEWLFNILNYVESNVNLNNRDSYQRRVYGFLAERLQNVWINHNNLKIKRIPIYFVEKNVFISKLKSLRDFVLMRR